MSVTRPKFKQVKFKDLKPGLNKNRRVMTIEYGEADSYSSAHFDIIYVNKEAKEAVLDVGYLTLVSATKFDKQDFIYEDDFERQIDLEIDEELNVRK